MFAGKLDYEDWIILANEPRENIGFLESEWNDFDRLTPRTKMLHNTRRITQPWKTGLPIDFTPPDSFSPIPVVRWIMRVGRHIYGRDGRCLIRMGQERHESRLERGGRERRLCDCERSRRLARHWRSRAGYFVACGPRGL
jgi:hypothetical protein